GTDNFPTRYLVNDACVLLKKPNVYGSIFRFDGQASVFYPGQGPCYRCLYPEPPPPGEVPSCAEGGVLGILPGLIGCIQATEAVKLILGTGSPLVGRLLLYDALQMSFREFKVRRIPGRVLLPLPVLAQRFRELDPEREMVVHCKSGMRSAKAIQFLREQGYRKLTNLKGGILAWADKVDKGMMKY